jgi:hypothetical protein
MSLSGAIAAAGAAKADTVFVEPEGPVVSGYDYGITSPMLIKDDSNASMGRYLTVEAGNDSKNSAPSVEGVTRQTFTVANSGTYRIWGRVIAPNDGDDSFWIKVGGTTIKWSPIELGSSWHWDIVKHNGGSSPVQLSLAAGTYDLEVGYREDGTKLDVLVFTDDTSFNPDSPPTTVPTSNIPGISFPFMRSVGSNTAIKVMWSAVPGATSYTVRRITESGATVWQTGLTTLSVSDTTLPPDFDFNCYDVLAIFPDSSYRVPPEATCAQAPFRLSFLDIASLSVTPPMMLTEGLDATAAPGTTESLNTVPAHGRLRFDFMTGGSTQLRLWFRAFGTNPDADSFWVRMDDGAWFKWNNFTGLGGACMPVGNFTNDPVTFSVGAGSHRFEIAYREIGATLQSNFFVTDNLQATSSICND